MREHKDLAQATPTKRFFVSMLTRDISLADAILDLIDNCLDGALRSFEGEECDDYSRFQVDLTLSGEEFTIKDNCGGIPRHVAKDYAFRFGREADDERDIDEETIGMYGVGMKRALFKMGRDSLVTTRHQNDCFEVPISSEWLDNKDWNSLPMITLDADSKMNTEGTLISVKSLYPFVVREFKSDSFVVDLNEAIAEHFTYFLQRGLKVVLNNEEIDPVYVEVLAPEDSAVNAAPYVYEETVDGVLIRVVVGVNSRVRRNENKNEEEHNHSAKSAAGWSIFCNNRAVVVGDYSRLTWSPKLPRYHDQYNIITGIVEFKSKDADKLPVSTTKRDLDANSDLWWEAQKWMYEGMRLFLDYTNNWKNHSNQEKREAWESATPMSAEKVSKVVAKRNATPAPSGKVYFNPRKNAAFPEPPNKKATSRKIVFSRPQDEVKQLSEWFFDVEDEKPGRVGEECFIQALEIMKKATD